MKTLYLDLAMGAAGDMLAAALYELLNDEDKKRFIDDINNAGIPGVKIIPEKSVKCGITGTHMKVLVDGHEEAPSHHGHAHSHDGHGHDHHDHIHEDHGHGHEIHDHIHEEHEHAHEEHSHVDHEHVHEHDHERSHDHVHDHEAGHEHHHGEGHHGVHSHVHRSLHDIEHIINGLNIPSEVKEHAREVYTLIAQAESHAHGMPVTEIHFHEVGTMDAVADVTAVSLLINMLAPDTTEASFINVGGGHVHCAHGILPVPAPATAYILKDVPIYQGHILSELCTPTGAALLKHYVTRFGSMPVMKIQAAGYGMGKKDFEQANCVRAFIGEPVSGNNDTAGTCKNMASVDGTVKKEAEGTITELVCNVDDMTGENMGYAIDILLKSGALETYTVPVFMKKSRPGMELKVLCRNEDKDKMVGLIFAHTSTLGIREYICPRYTLSRRIEERTTPYGTMRLKVSEGYGVLRKKWEYDDIAGVAKKEGVPFRTVTDTLCGYEKN